MAALGAQQGVDLHVRGFEFEEFGIVRTEVDLTRRMKRAGFQLGVSTDRTGNSRGRLILQDSFLSIFLHCSGVKSRQRSVQFNHVPHSCWNPRHAQWVSC